ncbi:uncharacterized protein TNIN_2121 [Trichonephila inaurata madagascariensis]|uniref:Uncharacterized protein n=1 Tax=Trichonephila inaurata madagascariensis TaxID=2747483 RepID=A0A8X7CS30_9ARAC|nr:uncharacterized protein TNIN_2121 [Trichonephila inaurata madagascariensis]
MPPKVKKKNGNQDDWRKHDTYQTGVSYSRIPTRSQTAFVRVENGKKELDLFSNPRQHQPPNKPHLLATMKGGYGNIPRTIITRSTAERLPPTETLYEALEDYKNYQPPETADSSEFQKEATHVQPKTAIEGKASTEQQETKPAILGKVKKPTISQPHLPPKVPPPELDTSKSQVSDIPHSDVILADVPPELKAEEDDL